MNFGVEGIVANSAFLALFIVLLLGVMLAVRRRRRRPDNDGVPDEPEGTPYRVYTRTYDLELAADSIPGALPDASLDRLKGYLHNNPLTWPAWAGVTDKLVDEQATLLEAWLPRLQEAMAGLDADEVALAVLIDQSGSMKGERIVHAAATADFLAQLAAALGISSEILGFSTAGWHGGKAYEAWRFAGQPARPGRLCALLHIVYKSTSEPRLSSAARRAMLHPDLLRENVDGEALLWAQERLARLTARHRLLMVISDGAPVDDATLKHNGPSILTRHVIQVAQDVEQAGLILGGLGVHYAVGAYYPRAEAATTLATMPDKAATLLARMLGDAAARETEPI